MSIKQICPFCRSIEIRVVSQYVDGQKVFVCIHCRYQFDERDLKYIEVNDEQSNNER